MSRKISFNTEHAATKHELLIILSVERAKKAATICNTDSTTTDNTECS